MQKRANLAGMVKAAEDRDEFGRWAYDARAVLGLSADWVAAELGYHRTAIVRAEGQQRSRKMARELPRLYAREAAKQGVVLPPAPGGETPSAPTPTPDLAALIVAMTRQTDVVTDLLAALHAEKLERLALQVRLSEIEGQLRDLAAARREDAAQEPRSAATTPGARGVRPRAASGDVGRS